jgi:gas vesicle protein
MIEPTQDPLDYRFVMGLITGTVVAAGVLLWFAPRARAELRGRLGDSAEALGTQASEAYRNVDARVTEAVGDLARKGQKVRNDVADAVARGAHEVERLAVVAKTAPRSSS